MVAVAATLSRAFVCGSSYGSNIPESPDPPHTSGECPTVRQHGCLLQDGERRPLLLVRRVTVFTQDALDVYPELGPRVLADRPVDRHVRLDRRDQLAGDVLQG